MENREFRTGNGEPTNWPVFHSRFPVPGFPFSRLAAGAARVPRDFLRRTRYTGVMLTAGDFKRGVRIELDGDPYVVMEVHFQSPSARGASTLVKARVRNLRSGNVFDRTFKTADKVAEAAIEFRPVQFLYGDGDGYHFMDAESYEQFTLRDAVLGADAGYLIEGLAGLRSVVFNGSVMNIELPQSVVLRIRETDPALRGASAQAQTKPATLETGLVIQVPAYLESGDAVQVDTSDGRFMARVKG
jgi:elongation factor P